MKENKHKNLCPWYDKYKVDDKGKILHTIYNILVLFVNDPRFKGKFSLGISKVDRSNYEMFNNRRISEYDISVFRCICEEELGFEDKDKINCAIKTIVIIKDPLNFFKTKY